MAKQITPAELAMRIRAMEEVNIIDVREKAEVEEGRIIGAKHIPLGQLPLRKDELDQNKVYIVVCRSGNRSKAASGILEAFGYEVEDMVGGMNDWNGELG
ncbi:rhodanese-like domain-containing protein [Virgibacillus sp. DJP39]|uniref:rhodanese-like domain-containing protein n=1 Tax=Virgibacillus sp. DJP39 TaxID=3409790 RepID=UPI003BB6823B